MYNPATGAAAAAHRARLQEEEETLTKYSTEDLDGWEFKIVRSSGKITGDRFDELCKEEGENGWELVEKFDDYRVRFKRRVEHREQDGYSEVDPYRTQVGLSEGKLVLMILGIAGVSVATIILVITLITS